MTDAGAVDPVAAQAVDILPSFQVREGRSMATPFDGRHAIGLRDRLRVVQDSAVVVGAEIFERFLSDSLPPAYSQPPRRNDIQPPLGFLSQGFKRQVHGSPVCGRTFEVKDRASTTGPAPAWGNEFWG